jgi:hypothetical protein
MIRPKEKSKAEPGLLDRLSPDVKRAIDKCRETFREAAELRETFPNLEAPIKEWEKEVRERTPKGRRWKTLSAELIKSLTAASNLHEQVSRREKAALSLYRKAIARIRHLADSSEITVPARAVELLDEVARLRSVELEWLGGALQHSRVILSLPQGSPPDRVLILLEQRQHYMGRVGSLGEESERLEEQALGIEPEPKPVPENEGEAEPAIERMRGVEPTASPGREGGEETKEKEWDDWLDRVQGRTKKVGSETDREKAMDKTSKEQLAEKKTPSTAAKPASAEKPAAPPPAKEPPAPAPVAKAGDDKAHGLTTPFDALGKSLAETIESRLSQARADIDRLVKAELDRIQTEHDRALSQEVRARQEAEQKGRKLSDDLTQTKGLLSKAEDTIAANEKKHQADIEDEKKRSANVKADLDGKIGNLKKEAEDFRKRITDLEKADRDMKATVKANEEMLAAKTKKLAEERAEMVKKVEVADQERDDALVLITSLSRRLKTSGLEESISKGGPKK